MAQLTNEVDDVSEKLAVTGLNGSAVVPGVDPELMNASLPASVRPELMQAMRAKVDAVSGLSEVEKNWLDDACLARYIRARKMDVDKAFAMIQDTLKWRKEFDVVGLLQSDLNLVKSESTTGKMYAGGHDKSGRPILYMKPRNQNTKDTTANIQHLVYSLERTCANAVSPQEKMVLILDFKGYGLRNAPSVKVMKETLHILQNHYPERLGLAICVEAPALFFGFYKVITPFIDPVTAKKVQFLERTKQFAEGTKALATMKEFFDLDQVEAEYGGNIKEPYNNDRYFAERFIPSYMR
eukprot:Plantae.Rhodophyta-Purpureofilum_apyrenoidigerum.ctg12151.p1 GENE.Plantae.Rhodophyta-Purpureofilum_apyrenoidigerum.ctg12151~~Plantae.Rhodophyta-Purpureofilum_apyrenoidigerum.ctg12151.p1  ORF type:complete len:296 (-),score=69.50 Plantae.Rhodophyta-Purpureofilum_apyrenoidigerum.ctg12151:266-1153(-)